MRSPVSPFPRTISRRSPSLVLSLPSPQRSSSDMSGFLGELIDMVRMGVQDAYTSRYASLAASSIIVYDHLLTLDNEFELIWQSSWSIGKALFFINRYYSLISVIINNYFLFGTNLTDSGCRKFFYWQGWTGLIACMIAETILQMRLYAMYFLDKKILCLMVGTFILTSASAATVITVALNQMTALSQVPLVVPSMAFCIPMAIPPYIYAFWIPILAFETLLFVLAVLRGIQTYRHTGSTFQSNKRLVGLLIRDSIAYYVVMFATYLTCLLIFLLKVELLEVPIGFSVALSCVLGNRVILNVRKVNEELKESGNSRLRGDMALDKGTGGTHTEHESDTLTDFEMAQLRSMKTESIEGGHIVI